MRARIRVATSWSISPRSIAGVAAQERAASRAAAIAASTCSDEGRPTEASSDSVNGFSTESALAVSRDLLTRNEQSRLHQPSLAIRAAPSSTRAPQS